MKEKDTIQKDDSVVDVTPENDRLFRIKSYILAFWKDAIDLEHGVDKRLIINEIKTNNSMSGANAWMLMCSIVIASVGLNMNSPAVIIGGMLISPLMSPILGMGLAIGINDKNTLKRSLSHFGMAVTIAIVTSTIYFMITPLQEITSEIAARTEPTPLDIFIAFFGGIAGIVSIARKDISTTIPGVAIATALMPPLCVTGFGLANIGRGYGEIALWSFFLFFINTVFVSFATYVIVRFVLKFPSKDFADAQEQRKNTIFISVFLLLITAISFFPFRKLLRDQQNNIAAKAFVEQVFEGREGLFDGQQLLSHGDSSLLIIKVYGDGSEFISPDNYLSLKKQLELERTTIQFVPTTSINQKDIDQLNNKILSIQDVSSQVETLKNDNTEMDSLIIQLKDRISTYTMTDSAFQIKTNTIRAMYDADIIGVSYGKSQSTDFRSDITKLPLYLISWNSRSRDYKMRERQIKKVLYANNPNDSLIIVHRYE